MLYYGLQSKSIDLFNLKYNFIDNYLISYLIKANLIRVKEAFKQITRTTL